MEGHTHNSEPGSPGCQSNLLAKKKNFKSFVQKICVKKSPVLDKKNGVGGGEKADSEE